MPWTKDERIEIILMAGSLSCCEVAMDFNRKRNTRQIHKDWKCWGRVRVCIRLEIKMSLLGQH